MRHIVATVLVVAAILLLVLCSWQQRRLVAARERHALTPETALSGAPPAVAFTTVVLGGFRGVLADVLWLRVSGLQSEGRFFELVQLSEWITMLEPRATGTWSFHAWNMAYNVSSLMADPAERWQWVQNGIRLLRDKGLRYNPHDARLHFELGWLFQHKVGTHIDRAWLYFQQRLATETDAVMPGGRLPAAALAPGSPAAQAIRDRLGLEPETVHVIDASYGPLDWRLPESQALYWAYTGLQRGGDAHDFFCERMLYQSLAVSLFRGTLTLDPAAGVYARSPRPALFDQVLAAYATARTGPNEPRVRESYRHFLKEAASILAEHGDAETAARAQALLRAEDPGPH